MPKPPTHTLYFVKGNVELEYFNRMATFGNTAKEIVSWDCSFTSCCIVKWVLINFLHEKMINISAKMNRWVITNSIKISFSLSTFFIEIIVCRILFFTLFCSLSLSLSILIYYINIHSIVFVSILQANLFVFKLSIKSFSFGIYLYILYFGIYLSVSEYIYILESVKFYSSENKRNKQNKTHFTNRTSQESLFNGSCWDRRS